MLNELKVATLLLISVSG